MIGLDTNVLVRFLAQDDEKQSPIADQIIGSLTSDDPGWIGLATILELVWVLSSQKRAGRLAVSTALDRLLRINAVIVEEAGIVTSAVRQFRSTRADFADCLIAESARAAGCSRTVTFDKIAARDAGMELLA